MKGLLARFVRDEEGQDLIEYGLLAGVITAAVTFAITAVAGKVTEYYEALNAALPDVD